MNFIVFSDDWGRHPSSCEHIFRCLLDEHRVIWVNTIGYRSPRFNIYDIKRSFEKIMSWFSSSDTVEENKTHTNLQIISPIIIPFNGFKIIRRLNRLLMNCTLKKAIAHNKFDDYTLLSSHPTVADYYRDHPDNKKVYYCVDDFTVMPGVDKNLIGKLEKELIDISDFVFYTAKALKNKFSSSKKSFYLPHGVDNNHFSIKEHSSELSKYKKPIIGFFGMLSQWVDIDLVVNAAEKKPEWTFLFVGNTDIDLEKYKNIANVIFHGPIPYDKLPAASSAFDIGMIPFKVNQLTKAVNPLKFLEYTALGLPVVSTELPELRQYDDYVYFANDVDSFIESIKLALAADNDDKKNGRLKLAHDNSWKSRGQTLLENLS